MYITTARCLIALLAIGGLTACQSSDDEQCEEMVSATASGAVRGNFTPSNASTRTLIAVTDSNSYQPAEFAQTIIDWPMISYASETMMKLMDKTVKLAVNSRVPLMDKMFDQRYGTAADGARQWKVQRYVFTYKSVSGISGNDTTLVGSVVFPTNTNGRPHEIDMLTLYHHQAYFFDSWLPSNSLTMMAIHALHNSAVIEPDAQGAEGNMVKLIASNLEGDVTCLQMVDCVLAALEVMRDHGVTPAPGYYSNSWGTSLGTVATAGFAQYMENDAPEDLQQLINLRATYMGEGPTELSHVRGLENAVANPRVQKYNNGWHPRLPFYISTCPNDELVNYGAMKEYYNKLRTMPDGTTLPNVHWLDLNVPHTDVEKMFDEYTGNHLLSAVIQLVYISMVEDPADMEGVMMPSN
jgi:hypothetical protein